MRLYRIGDKVVSGEKLVAEIETILEDREAGATQEEIARSHSVQRSFVSFLEALGEVRRGARVALVAFPVANVDAVRAVADKHSVDLAMVLSQKDREYIEGGSAADVFNRLLETLADLRDFDVVVLLASDWRVRTIERILGAEVVGIPLGATPLRDDVEVDVEELDRILAQIMSARPAHPGRVGTALREASRLAGRWVPSRKS